MKISVSKLSHHPLNKEIYKLSSIDELVASIDEIGLLEHLVIDKKNQVISGNRRLECIRRLKWRTVEIKRVDVEDQDIGKHLVHYNKHRIKTSRELLNEAQILEEHFVRMNKIGYGKKNHKRELVSKELGIASSRLAKLRVIQKYDDDLIDLIDKDILTVAQAYLQVQRIKKEEKTLNSSPKTKLNGDGFIFYKKSSDNMTELKDEEVQTIFTSPPYFNKRKYVKNGSGMGQEKTSDQYVENLIDHLGDCKRVLSNKGSFFLNLGDTYLNGNLQNIPHKIAIGLQDQGWILRNTIIWSKTNPKPSSSKSNLCPTYEFIFHFIKRDNYFYNLTLAPLKDSTKASLPPRHLIMDQSIKKRTVTNLSPYIPREGKNMGDFWNEDIVRTAVVNQKLTSNGNEHPAPFPEDIVTLPILQTSQEGDLILDLFMGSGTTGRVANRLNRRFVGYDLRTY